MKKISTFFLLIILVFLLTSCIQRVYASDSSTICRLNLHIFVGQGLNADYTISGQVMFGSNLWSSFEGNLVEENGATHPVSFYFTEQAIHFILDTEQGQIFGVGIMESSLASCSGKGGGTLSGPALGDLGDWRGEWVSEITASPQEQPREYSLSPPFICIGLPMAVLALIVAIYLLAPSNFLSFFKKIKSQKSKTSKSVLRRTDQVTKSEVVGGRQPLTEYLVTYTADDKLFDLSFEIEKSPHYLGECGITVAKALGTKSNQATALEIWLFSARGVQTVSKILMSDFCDQQEWLRSELQKKGQTLLTQPGDVISLETKELTAKAKILQLEYVTDSPNPRSIFKKVVIKIGVWENPN